MSGFGDIREQRAAAPEPEQLPHIFLLLDRWEGFTATLGDLEAGGLTEIHLLLMGKVGIVGRPSDNQIRRPQGSQGRPFQPA